MITASKATQKSPNASQPNFATGLIVGHTWKCTSRIWCFLPLKHGAHKLSFWGYFMVSKLNCECLWNKTHNRQIEEKNFWTMKGLPHYPKFGKLWPTIVNTNCKHGTWHAGRPLACNSTCCYAYLMWRPCSDFTDMLRRHINCRIIIIIIMYANVAKFSQATATTCAHWTVVNAFLRRQPDQRALQVCPFSSMVYSVDVKMKGQPCWNNAKADRCEASSSIVIGRVPTWHYCPQQYVNVTHFSYICCYFRTLSDWTTGMHHDSGLAASIFWLTSDAAVRSTSSSSCLFIPRDLYMTTKQNHPQRKYSYKRKNRQYSYGKNNKKLNTLLSTCLI